MTTVISVKQLRARLGTVAGQVRNGQCFTVLCRSRPVFDIVPVGVRSLERFELKEDPIYKAKPLGESGSGDVAQRHDEVLYR